MPDFLLAPKSLFLRILHGLHRLLGSIISPLPAFQAECLALLIDGENMSSEWAVHVLAAAGKFGAVNIRRIYGDWTQPALSGWQAIASHYAMVMIHYHPPVAGKNASDIRLATDAVELYRDGMRRFCLVSCDSDFTPLILHLCEQRCFVLGIGKPETHPTFQSACTIFLTTDQLIPSSTHLKRKSSALVPAPPMPQGPSSAPPASSSIDTSLPSHVEAEIPLLALLQDAYKKVVEFKGREPIALGELGNMLKRLDAQFKVKTYGSATLRALVQKYPEVFLVQQKGKQTFIQVKREGAKEIGVNSHKV